MHTNCRTAFHAASAMLTMALELLLIFAVFFPRRWRIILFFVITPWQIGIILTSNYAFLNYLVLVLGFLLLDDKFLAPFLPQNWKLPASLPQDSSLSVQNGIRSWPGHVRLGIQAIFLTLDFLCDLGASYLHDVPSRAAARRSRPCARTVSDCQ